MVSFEKDFRFEQFEPGGRNARALGEVCRFVRSAARAGQILRRPTSRRKTVRMSVGVIRMINNANEAGKQAPQPK